MAKKKSKSTDTSISETDKNVKQTKPKKEPKQKKEKIKATNEEINESTSESHKEQSSSPVKIKSKNDSIPEINIGLVGHVDHGKTTLTKSLSGKWTDTHSEELKRGITIRLGYANTNLYYYKKSKTYGVKEKSKDGEQGEVVRCVSFVDAPGHETLMATMLSGSTIMDGAILLVSANEKCPQPQTREHLMALQISDLTNIIVVQNKIDLVSEGEALKNYEQIKELLKETKYKDAPIIPMSALHSANMDILVKAIQEFIPTPKRDSNAIPLMFVARSFDMNKPGTEIMNMKGGVVGGALKQGSLKVGETIEIRPGRKIQKANQWITEPIKTEIVSIMSGNTPITNAGPGGSIALLTKLDPAVTASDGLSGSVVGFPGKLPPVWYDLKFKATLLERVVGAKDDLVVKPLAENEILMINVNSAATVGVINDLSKKSVKVKLKLPVCADIGSKINLARQLGNRWRLNGYGVSESN